MSGVVYMFQCGFCNWSYYGECVRHLNVRTGEHKSTPLRNKKQVRPKNSSVGEHLLTCNHLASYGDFSILVRENKKFYWNWKGSLLITRDQPSLNRNIIWAPLYLFVRILFVFNSSYIIFIKWAFYYFFIYKCKSTTARDNGTLLSHETEHCHYDDFWLSYLHFNFSSL